MMISDNKYYLGIDLGTSSVKAVLMDLYGNSIKAKRGYDGVEPECWLTAVKELISELNGKCGAGISAISLSSQVGTYIVNGKDVISWRSDAGKDELEQVCSAVTNEEFINGIAMPHPKLVSYPLPRLMYIQKHYGESAEVLMPKEFLIRELTGNTVSDVFSMRGIADPRTARYADGITEKLGISLKLPELKRPTELAGYVTDAACAKYGLPSNIPVYLGCNDFFAGLLGMGICKTGDFFDLSGTSEHVGYISESINEKAFVSGGYFAGNCSYGGTKASGSSCDLAIKNFGIDGIELERVLAKKPPIFLPYLCGERAPVFDENARGVYFGINDRCDRESLAYATLEGVIFSLYHIATEMNAPKPQRLICGGGSARNPMMNALRATLFDCETVSVADNDTSALGACMLAMVGDGAYPDIPTAIRHCVKYMPSVYPHKEYRDILMKRFEIYRSLYGDLKQSFKKFRNI